MIKLSIMLNLQKKILNILKPEIIRFFPVFLLCGTIHQDEETNEL